MRKADGVLQVHRSCNCPARPAAGHVWPRSSGSGSHPPPKLAYVFLQPWIFSSAECSPFPDRSPVQQDLDFSSMPLLVPSKKEPDSTVILKKQTVPPPGGGVQGSNSFSEKSQREKTQAFILPALHRDSEDRVLAAWRFSPP